MSKGMVLLASLAGLNYEAESIHLPVMSRLRPGDQAKRWYHHPTGNVSAGQPK